MLVSFKFSICSAETLGGKGSVCVPMIPGMTEQQVRIGIIRIFFLAKLDGGFHMLCQDPWRLIA